MIAGSRLHLKPLVPAEAGTKCELNNDMPTIGSIHNAHDPSHERDEMALLFNKPVKSEQQRVNLIIVATVLECR